MRYDYFAREHSDEPAVCYTGHDKNLPAGITYGPVIRDVFIVECCTGGFGSVVINGREFSLKKGDCFFLFPGDVIIHTAATENPREGYYCAIDGLQIGSVLLKAGITSTSPFAPPSAFEEITQSLKKIYEMRDDTDGGAGFRRTSLIYAILASLMSHSNANPDKNTWIKKAIGIMETNYHTCLTVEKIARETGLERCYFSTLFKAQTGKSPHEYLTSLRINKACALMKQRNMSISHIALSVGLDDRNFSRLFKKETGFTPLEYVKRKDG